MQDTLPTDPMASSPIDTVTPALSWYSYNVIVLVASLLMSAIAGLIVEHQLARLLHPQVGFIAVPLWPGLIFSTIVLLLGLANIIILIFVFMRHLWRRPWMVATTLAGWVLLAVIALIFGQDFLPVLIP